jgi:hypothetical protein
MRVATFGERVDLSDASADPGIVTACDVRATAMAAVSNSLCSGLR